MTKEVVTPTMDALVKAGIELNRHYVHMMCTPTRSSFQSGRLPIHVLTQLSSPCDHNGAIPRNMTGIAAQLKKAGYSTHQVGKWFVAPSPAHTRTLWRPSLSKHLELLSQKLTCHHQGLRNGYSPSHSARSWV